MKPSAKTYPYVDTDAPTPQAILAHLDRFVVGQDRAKRALAVAGYNHHKRIEARAARTSTRIRKSNVLMIGPTGCGKTHLARHLAEALGVPFAIVDATEYTEAGYYGKDVEVMIAELLYKSNHSIEDTQRGVVFIDEVDKIARRTQGARTGAGTRDIGGEGVQQSLLKLLEGREVFVPMNLTQHWSKHDFVQVDTSDVLFVCAGTFSDLFDDRGEGPSRTIGFDAETAAKRRRRVKNEELLEYGMLRELLGRLPVVVQLDSLEKHELKRVLTDPEDALIREYQQLLLLDGIKLEVGEDALDAIAEHALERGYGARGLRGVIEELMRDVMFDAPACQGQRVVLDADWVRERLAALED